MIASGTGLAREQAAIGLYQLITTGQARRPPDWSLQLAPPPAFRRPLRARRPPQQRSWWMR
jgi:hypothetical protein